MRVVNYTMTVPLSAAGLKAVVLLWFILIINVNIRRISACYDELHYLCRILSFMFYNIDLL